MSLHNAPLTPPLTENDAQHLASQNQTSSTPQGAQRTGHAPTVYQDIFPRLSNLAIQNHLADLVALAEEADITADSEGRTVESRLLLVAPLVLSYLITNYTSPARIVLARLPDNLSLHPLTRSLFKVTAAVQTRTYSLVYKSTEELLALVQGDFFDSSLAAVIKLLADRHIHAFRQRTAELLSKAYTSLPSSLAQTYFSMPQDDIHRALEAFGWTYDDEKDIFGAQNSMPGASTNRVPSAVSSLSTVKQLVSGVAQVDAAA